MCSLFYCLILLNYVNEYMSYKTIDELMDHLKQNGISIDKEINQQQLSNTGYYHGYKSYRFFKTPNKQIPYQSFDEVYATIQYDMQIKSLLYDKVMFIETALKNIALEEIMLYTNSETIQAMFDIAISSYKNAPKNATKEQRKKFQQNKLNLQTFIHSTLASAYRKQDPRMIHYYTSEKYVEVPLWALFEILTMGDFANLLSCLTYDVRNSISKRVGIKTSFDTNRQFIYKYVYLIKELRNAIAHNAVIFDARFSKYKINKAMMKCIEDEFHLSYVNFKTIGDYIILITYFLKLLNYSKTDIQIFLTKFEQITKSYKELTHSSVSNLIIHSELEIRIEMLKSCLQ